MFRNCSYKKVPNLPPGNLNPDGLRRSISCNSFQSIQTVAHSEALEMLIELFQPPVRRREP